MVEWWEVLILNLLSLIVKNEGYVVDNNVSVEVTSETGIFEDISFYDKFKSYKLQRPSVFELVSILNPSYDYSGMFMNTPVFDIRNSIVESQDVVKDFFENIKFKETVKLEDSFVYISKTLADIIKVKVHSNNYLDTKHIEIKNLSRG